MSDESNLAAIRRWFERYRHGGLVLPDGWFGRPLDAAYGLTELRLLDGDLLLVLDDGLNLRLKGVEAVAGSKFELVIGPCTHIWFEWTTYDVEPQPRSSEYDSGCVRFVRIPPCWELDWDEKGR